MTAVLDRPHLGTMGSMTNTPGGTVADDGLDYKRRRLAAGFKSVRALADKSNISRDAISKVEAGKGTDYTRARLDAFFEKWDEETSSEYLETQAAQNGTGNGGNGGEAADEPFKVELGGVYGIENITFSGPVNHSQEIIERAVEFMRGVREQRPTDGNGDK